MKTKKKRGVVNTILMVLMLGCCSFIIRFPIMMLCMLFSWIGRGASKLYDWIDYIVPGLTRDMFKV